MTNIQVIDMFRETIRQISDDSVYSDEFLFEQINNARAKVVKHYLDKNKKFSPWMYQRFCIKLCPSTFVECNCEPFDFACTVWRSEKPIPRPLYNTNAGKTVFEVSELYGEVIAELTERSMRYSQFRNFKRNLYYIIGDVRGEKYLFVFTTTTRPPRYIKINTVLEDPSEASYVNCVEDDCPNILENEFPVDRHMLIDIFKITLEFLGLSMSMREDRSNNSEGDLKGFRSPKQEEE